MSTVLIKNARIATLDDDGTVHESADLLVEGSTISAIGADLPVPAGADVIDATGMLLMPGMVDTHNHLWENIYQGRSTGAWGSEYYLESRPLGAAANPDEIYAGTYCASVELLYKGVTSVLDYQHASYRPENLEADLAALKDSGIRAVLGYDLGAKPEYAGSAARFPHVEKLMAEADGSLVTIGIALSALNVGSRDTATEEIAFARAHGLPITFHNNRSGEITLLHEWGLLGPDILPAHGNWITAEEIDLLASVGGYLSASTEVESFGGNRSLTMNGRAHRGGVKITLGTDVPMMVPPGALSNMRHTYLLQRVFDGINDRAEGHVERPMAARRRPGSPSIAIGDALRFGTRNGAEAIGYTDVGSLRVGDQADMVLIDTRKFGMAEGEPAIHVLFHTSYGDIDTVIVAGDVVKRAGHMSNVDLEEVLVASRAAKDAVYARLGEDGASLGPAAEVWFDWVPERQKG